MNGRSLVAVGLTDVRSVRTIIWPAFQAEAGETAELDYRQEVDMGRLIEAVGGAEPDDRPDVLIVTDPVAFDSVGLLEPTEGLADPRLPGTWSDPGGRWAPLYVQPVVFVYNAHYRRPPSRWTDLLEPGWQARLVFEDPARMLTTGPALAELRSVLGDEGWREYLGRLAAQRPLIVADNERSVLEVATGARWGGFSNWNVARRVRRGSPVLHAFLDPTACIPGFGVRVHGGRAPELARRYLAWLVSDGGQRAYARSGRIPARAGADAPQTLDTVLPPGVGRLAGSVDWLRGRQAWVEDFRAAFPTEGPAGAGKLR
jgi:ABC-type Fe3+ transport system substrate-binding protein